MKPMEKPAIVWALLVFIVSTINAAQQTQPASNGPRPEAPASNLNEPEFPFFGVQLHSLQWEPEKHRRAVDLMVQAGIQLGRDECYWSVVEKNKGELIIPPDFLTNLDYTLERGREILLILNYSNQHYDGGRPPVSEEGRAAFARYCRTVVGATKGKIRFFEVWNEPNADGFWPPRADARAYASLLKTAAAAIREANPDAVILAPAASGLAEDFLREMLREPGVWESFDVLSFHPYCHPAAPDSAQIFERLDALMDELRSFGAPKPVWLTEFGYHTAELGGVSEREQAAYLVRFYLLALSRPYICGAVWYWLGPDGPQTDWSEDRFGLVRDDYTWKPSFVAYRGIINHFGRLGVAPGASSAIVGQRASSVKRIPLNGEPGVFLLQFDRAEKGEECMKNGKELPARGGDRVMFAAWSSSGPRTLSLTGAPLRDFTDLVTQAAVPLLDRDRLILNVTADPVLFFGAEKGGGALSAAGVFDPIRFAPSSLTVYPGLGTVIQFHDESSEGFGRWSVQAPVNGGLMARMMSSDEIEVYASQSARIGPHPLQLSATRAAHHSEPETPAGLIYRFDCLTSEPISVSAGLRKARTGHPLVQLAVQNNTDRMLPAALKTSIRRLYGDDVATFETTFPLDPSQLVMKSVELNAASLLDDELFSIVTESRLQAGSRRVDDEVVSIYEARRLKDVKIDGDLSDWRPAGAPIRLGERWQVTGEFRPWRGPGDSHARIWVGWDDDWFYFAAEFEDDAYCAEFDDWQVYRNDGFELYFDTNHDGDRWVKTYNEDDFQWGVFPTKAGPVVWRWAHYNSASPGARFAFNRHPHPEQTISGRPFEGYIYEAALPVGELKWTPREGQRIGFNVAFTDADDPEFVHPFGQEVQLTWSGRRNSHLSPHAFADLYLGGPAAGANSMGRRNAE